MSSLKKSVGKPAKARLVEGPDGRLLTRSPMGYVYLLLPLAFLAHLDFLELRMPDNHRIVIPRGNPAAELLAVCGLKILLGGDEDRSEERRVGKEC